MTNSEFDYFVDSIPLMDSDSHTTADNSHLAENKNMPEIPQRRPYSVIADIQAIAVRGYERAVDPVGEPIGKVSSDGTVRAYSVGQNFDGIVIIADRDDGSINTKYSAPIDLITMRSDLIASIGKGSLAAGLAISMTLAAESTNGDVRGPTSRGDLSRVFWKMFSLSHSND